MNTRPISGRLSVYLALVLMAFTMSQADTWRALIVYTNAVDSAEAYQPLYERFLGIFDEINDLYKASGMTTRAEVAGVIWDKEYQEEHLGVSLLHITGNYYDDPPVPSGGMDRYINLLEKYSADVLIFRGNYGSLGYAVGYEFLSGVSAHFETINQPMPQEYSPYVTPPIMPHYYPDIALEFGAFAVGNDNAMLWAHEVGHLHDLAHCNGLRMTFNAAGNYTESSATSGFFTTMEYRSGAYCNDGGQIGFMADPVFSFSNPDSTYSHYHPQLQHDSIYALGSVFTFPIQNSAFIHDTTSSYIGSLRQTPSNLTLTDDMALESYDYGNFLASNSVTIEPGFRVESGANLKINVGSQTLAKRGILAQERATPPRETSLESLGKISNFAALYNPILKLIQVSFEAPDGTNASLVLFDLKGVRRAKLGDFQASGKTFWKTFSLSGLPNGTYFMKAQIGSESFQRSFVKW